MSTEEIVPQKHSGGRPRTTQRLEYLETARTLRSRYAGKALDAQENLFRLADGIWIEETDDKGKRIVYKTPPNYFANNHIIERVLGRAESESDVELAKARTALAMQQVKAGFYKWQAEFLQAQAEGKRIENELVPKQFVSEEEEREHIQTLLLALNRPLLHMTPEKAAEFGISPDRLEDLKGYLGVSQAAVIEEVFEGKAEDVLDEDDDNDTSSED